MTEHRPVPTIRPEETPMPAGQHSDRIEQLLASGRRAWEDKPTARLEETLMPETVTITPEARQFARDMQDAQSMGLSALVIRHARALSALRVVWASRTQAVIERKALRVRVVELERRDEVVQRLLNEERARHTTTTHLRSSDRAHITELRARVAELEAFAADLAERGTRHDLTPTITTTDAGRLTAYIRDMDKSIRDRACRILGQETR